jgi:predicted  nucleic acid-binding Zn-ribbon protein
VDQRLASVQRGLNELPRETERRERELNGVRKEMADAQKALKDMELRGGQLDLNIKSADAEMKKLEVRMNMVRTNAELMAVKLQMDTTREERGKNEEALIVLLDQIEAARKLVEEKAARVAAGEGSHAEYLAKAEKYRKEREADAAVILAERQKTKDGVARELLDLYDRLFRSRDGLAVVSVDNRICHGCYTEITPNDEARLIGDAALVQCKSCARILYLHS